MKLGVNTLLIIFLFLSFEGIGQSEKPIAKQVEVLSKTFEQTEELSFFKRVDQKSLSPEITKDVESANYFNLEASAIAKVMSDKPNVLRTKISLTEGMQIDLQLYQADVMGEDMIIKLAKKEEFNREEMAIHYWGTIKGEENSLVSISISPDQMMGLIMFKGRQFTLGKLEKSKTHILYETEKLLVDKQWECGNNETHESQATLIEDKNITITKSSTTNCVHLYVEVDNDIVTNKGGVTPATNYITGLFSQVFILYSDESITMDIGELFVWNTVDPYTSNNPSTLLVQFRNNLNGNYNGDLAHLVSFVTLGGVAYLDVLCNSFYGVGFSGISSSYSNVPTYSWSVEVITHEIGHNLGANHTHDCVWGVQNNSPLDCCGQNAGYPSSSCGNGYNCNIPNPSNGGTIMSYCHLLSGVGINFNNGFGTEPGDRIRDEINNAYCLNTCNDCSNNGGDQDGDGYCANVDCDDNNPNINPGATEVCDGVDNNCDGQVDEGVLNTYYLDNDGDNFGQSNNSIMACNAPSGYVSNGSDCDDNDPNINPGATEVCDGIDNNCNGQVDENCGPCTYQVIDFNDFESGWGIWNDGGSDCRRSRRDASYAIGTYCARLRDNTSTSVMTTDNLDLLGYDEITVDFTYYPRSMDNSNEDFWLQISTNGGSSFTTVEEWNRDDEFVNNQRYYDNVVISGPFSSNTKLRFRCDASGNSDWVYIDEVDISGCYNNSFKDDSSEDETVALRNKEDETIEEKIITKTELKLYPNPVMDQLIIELESPKDTDGYIQVIDLEGKIIYEERRFLQKGENAIKLNITDERGGMYILRYTNGKEQMIKSFIKI